MAMIPGSVTISGGGAASGTGYAKEVYDVLEAGTNFLGITPPALVVAKQQLADLANACASLITHVQTNSQVTGIPGTGAEFTSTGNGTVS